MFGVLASYDASVVIDTNKHHSSRWKSIRPHRDVFGQKLLANGRALTLNAAIFAKLLYNPLIAGIEYVIWRPQLW